MRIVKKFLDGDRNETAISVIFDECVKSYPNKLPVDKIALRMSSMTMLLIDENKAEISLNKSMADTKVIRSIIYENFNRILAKKSFGELPQLIEDVIVTRETAKILRDDYFYYLYLKTAASKPRDLSGYLSNSVPWMAFSLVDRTASDMLRSVTRNKVYEAKAKSLIEALQKNLWIGGNLARAVKRYERLYAGNKIQVGKV